MKALKGIVDMLNVQLRTEVQAVEQYTLWGYQCVEWGFPGIKELLDLIIVDEMDHRKLITERVLRLEGVPDISFSEPVVVAKDVPTIIKTGIRLESEAVVAYNAGIQHAQDTGDNTTANMFTEILGDEEVHLSYYEREQRALETLGLAQYLAEQRG